MDKGVRWLPPEQLPAAGFSTGHSRQEARKLWQSSEFAISYKSKVGTFRGGPVCWAGLGKAHPHLFALHKHQDAVLRQVWAGPTSILPPAHYSHCQRRLQRDLSLTDVIRTVRSSQKSQHCVSSLLFDAIPPQGGFS